MRNQVKLPNTDHSKTTAFWHDLDKCAVCLKTFLPQVHEQKLKDRQAARERGEVLLPKDHVKPRGSGFRFAKKS